MHYLYMKAFSCINTLYDETRLRKAVELFQYRSSHASRFPVYTNAALEKITGINQRQLQHSHPD